MHARSGLLAPLYGIASRQSLERNREQISERTVQDVVLVRFQFADRRGGIRSSANKVSRAAAVTWNTGLYT